MKNKKKIIIIAIFIVAAIATTVFFITKNLNKEKVNNDVVFDYTEDDYSGLENSSNALNNIFGDNLSEEDKMFLSTTNVGQTNELNFVIKETDTSTVITSDTKTTSDRQVVNGNGQFEEPSPIVATKKTLPAKPMTSYKMPSSSYTQPVRISSFILDYNKTKTASRENPLLVTIVTKAPENARFLKIRVFARRLSKNNEILTRDLVFSLPKIYVVDGQSQTQFYFAGRTSGGKYLQKGRYLLYAEVEVVDSNGKSVGKTGRYPIPKWDYVVTLK